MTFATEGHQLGDSELMATYTVLEFRELLRTAVKLKVREGLLRYKQSSSKGGS